MKKKTKRRASLFLSYLFIFISAVQAAENLARRNLFRKLVSHRIFPFSKFHFSSAHMLTLYSQFFFAGAPDPFVIVSVDGERFQSAVSAVVHSYFPLHLFFQKQPDFIFRNAGCSQDAFPNLEHRT